MAIPTNTVSNINKGHNMQKLNNTDKANKSYHDGYHQEFNVGFIPHKSGKYRIEIDGAIEHVSQFSTAIQVLGMATEEDEVEIHLSCCPGGSTNAGGTFIHAMQKCQAHIHIVAGGGNHSAATDILLMGDSYELASNFNSLIHNGSSGSIGNINEYFAQAAFDKEFIKEQQREILEGFLTPEEIEGVFRGDNIWLDAKGWHERSLKRQEYFQTKYSEDQIIAAMALREEQRIEEMAINSAQKPVAKKPLKIKPAKKAATDSTN